MLKITILGLVALFVSSPAFASPECENAEDQTTMTKCAADEFAKADKQLNTSYKEIEKRLADDPETKKLLINSQRAWIKFRDAECSFSASSTLGGSIHPMLIASCATQLTIERNKQLKVYLTCVEGDLTCPVPAAD